MILSQISLEDAMLGQFVGFQGRIGRGTWWLGQLLIVILLVVGVSFVGLTTHGSGSAAKPALGSLGLAAIFYLICVVINVSVSVKRYHDRGKSGWWFFLVFIPLIGGIWQLIELGFCSGDDGDNDYGPPPGAARRMGALGGEIAGMKSNTALAKLDDNYLADYARKIAMQQAEAQAGTSTPSFGGGAAKPVFGKR